MEGNDLMKKWSIMLLGALAMALSYEFNLYIIPFFVLSGLFVIVDRAKEKFPKEVAIPILLFVLIHSRWFLSLMQWEGWGNGLLVFLLASLLGYAWLMLAVYLSWRVRRLKWGAVYRGLFFVIIEQLMLLGIFGYPLFSIYYTQAFSPFLGLSKFPLIGSGWISFFVIVISSIGADIIQHKGRRTYRCFIIFFMVWFMIASAGNIWRSSPTSPRKLDVIVLQPNIKEVDKLIASHHGDQLDYYTKLIRRIQETEADWDVLFLPESLIGDLWEEKISLAFRELGLSDQQMLVFGQPLERDSKVYNTVCFFQNGRIQKVYSKHKLVPYSEAKPPFFNFLSKKHVRYFSPGPQPETIRVKGVGYGTTLCYESMFPSCFKRLKQADILVVLTNDAWFDKYFQRLHLRSAIFRAAELRKPLVLANNTGISAVISPQGKVFHWVLSDAVGYIREPLLLQ
jgi:apolipoprotein N-acyltransferase